MSVVLIIDDNPDHRLIYKIWLEEAGFDVIDAESGTEGIRKTLTEHPDCILVDYFIGGENGFVLLRDMLKDISGCPPIILLTCALTEALDRNSMILGAFACFDKSTLERAELLETINNAVRSRQ